MRGLGPPPAPPFGAEKVLPRGSFRWWRGGSALDLFRSPSAVTSGQLDGIEIRCPAVPHCNYLSFSGVSQSCRARGRHRTGRPIVSARPARSQCLAAAIRTQRRCVCRGFSLRPRTGRGCVHSNSSDVLSTALPVAIKARRTARETRPLRGNVGSVSGGRGIFGERVRLDPVLGHLEDQSYLRALFWSPRAPT
jgi:hypothetical protein